MFGFLIFVGTKPYSYVLFANLTWFSVTFLWQISLYEPVLALLMSGEPYVLICYLLVRSNPPHVNFSEIKLNNLDSE